MLQDALVAALEAVCVCVCERERVCVCERERERERKGDTVSLCMRRAMRCCKSAKTEERQRESCMRHAMRCCKTCSRGCVCEREIERERESARRQLLGGASVGRCR